MAVGQPPVLHHGTHRRTQVQQPQGVGHHGAGLAHPLGGLLLREVILLHELPIALGLLDGVQILPLQVFDHGQLHGLAVVGFNDDGRHLVKPRHAGSPPAALAGDDLVVARLQLAHRQGLDDAVLPNGVRQIRQRIGVKLLAGLSGTAFHLRNGEVQAALFLRIFHHVVAQQGGQPFS